METEAISPRTFISGGEEWTVRITGRTRSGTGSDSGAPLLYLSFARVDGSANPTREAIAVGTSLDDLSDDELETLLRRLSPPS